MGILSRNGEVLRMKRTIFSALIVLLLSWGLVNAVTQQELNDAKSLIDSKADCKSLSNSQLEIIGEYYMEQMHPGTAHELMHEMMGLTEGSKAEEQFHINLARTLYCGESGGMMGGSMVNVMMGGGNMMGNYPGVYGYGNYGYWDIFQILFLLAIIFLVWFVYKFVTKKNSSSATPLNILKQRFAKGEITKKQFDAMKKDMED